MFVALVAFVLALTQSFLGFNENGVGWLVGTRTESSAIDSDGFAESNIDHSGHYIYDSTGAAQHGGSCASSHALGTGDDIFCNDVEIDGVLYADDDVTVGEKFYWNNGSGYIIGTQMNWGTNNASIATGTNSGYSRNMSIGTGNSIGAADLVSGTLTLFTGDTTTDGNVGNIISFTGVPGAGAVDGGDHIWYVNGESGTGTEGLRIDASGGGQVQIGVGLTPASYTSDPCGSLDAGSFWYNSTSGIPCYCNNAGADLKVADDAACF